MSREHSCIRTRESVVVPLRNIVEFEEQSAVLKEWRAKLNISVRCSGLTGYENRSDGGREELL